MTRDEIAEMAHEAGIGTGFVLHIPKWDKPTWLFMRRFAVLVAKKEREACAMEAEYEAARWPYAPECREPCEEIAAAIRARGQG